MNNSKNGTDHADTEQMLFTMQGFGDYVRGGGGIHSEKP